jgi:Rha family phage regulatory protein
MLDKSYAQIQIISQDKSLVVFNQISGKKVPSTTSIKISEVFEKRHDNILREINKLIKTERFTDLNFEASEYTDNTGKENMMYLLDETFTTVLIMRFTGHKALDWQISYSKEFQRLREELTKSQYIKRTKFDDPADRNELLTFTLSEARKKLGKEVKAHHFMTISCIVNELTFGESGKGKMLRKDMTAEQYQRLNRNINNVSKAVLMGHIHKKEILEFLNDKKLLRN